MNTYSFPDNLLKPSWNKERCYEKHALYAIIITLSFLLLAKEIWILNNPVNLELQVEAQNQVRTMATKQWILSFPRLLAPGDGELRIKWLWLHSGLTPELWVSSVLMPSFSCCILKPHNEITEVILLRVHVNLKGPQLPSQGLCYSCVLRFASWGAKAVGHIWGMI